MLLIALIIGILGWLTPAHAQTILEDWRLTGPARADFSLSVDSTHAVEGEKSLLLQGDPFFPDSVWAAFEGAIDIRPLSGARLRLTAYLRTDDADRATLWARVHGPDENDHFVTWGVDTMAGREIEGTTDWTQVEMILPAPSEARMLILGAVLRGGGRVWVDRIELSPVGEEVALTNPVEARVHDIAYREPPFLQGPVDTIGFEER